MKTISEETFKNAYMALINISCSIFHHCAITWQSCRWSVLLFYCISLFAFFCLLSITWTWSPHLSFIHSSQYLCFKRCPDWCVYV